MTHSIRKTMAVLLTLVLLLSNVPLVLASPFLTSNVLRVSNIIPPEYEPGNKDEESNYVELTGQSPNDKTIAIAIYQEDDGEPGIPVGSYWIAVTQQQESGTFKDIKTVKINGTVVWLDNGNYAPIIYSKRIAEENKPVRYAYINLGSYIPPATFSLTVDTTAGGYDIKSVSTGFTSIGSVNVYHVYGGQSYTDTAQSKTGLKIDSRLSINRWNPEGFELTKITVTYRDQKTGKTETQTFPPQNSVSIKIIRGVIDVVFTYSPSGIMISGTKTWKDNNNRDGARPSSITVLLMNGNTVVDRQTVTGPDWKYVFKNLPKYAGGKVITYTIKEADVAGYTSETSGYDLINTRTPESISVEGKKTWNDNEDQDGIRPTSIIVQLMNGKKIVDKKTVQGPDWTYSFTNLPKYAYGKEIHYTIKEVYVEGYTSKANGYDLTNTHIPETIKIQGTKTWKDNNNQDGARPTSITVLLMNGITEVDRQIVKGPDWEYTFKDLPKYANGKEIQYTIAEADVAGYMSEVKYGYNLINTRIPETISVEGKKTWDDKDNQDGIRPRSILVQLMNGRKVVDKKTVQGPEWTYSFTGLPKYANGREIQYTIKEVDVPGYKTKVDGYNLINTHTPATTKVEGIKTWKDHDNLEGLRPASITVLLMNGTTEVDRQTVTGPEWKYAFNNLPKYANGKETKYTIEEVAVDGYETKVYGRNLVNTRTPETTSVNGTKFWEDNNNQDGIRPTSITVKLMNGATEVDSKKVYAPWSYSFTNLPKYRNGQEIQYTIEEVNVTGYESKANGHDLTNTHTPETTSVNGTKFWEDNNNQDGIRPTSITVKLLNGTTEVDSKVVSEPWTYSFTELPKYANGQEIQYTIEEVDVDGYESKANGHDLTNTHTPETTTFLVEKVWEDFENRNNLRAPVTMQLVAKVGGQTIPWVDLRDASASKTQMSADGKVTLDKNTDKETHTFVGLPVYYQGERVSYEVAEQTVLTGYNSPEYVKNDLGGMSVINSIKTSTLTITKQIAGTEYTETESFQFRVVLDGEEGNAFTFSLKHGQSHSITNLPYGISYQVEETKPDGFIVTYDEYASGTMMGEDIATTVTNIYQASGAYDIDENLNPTKELTGRVMAEEEFSFELRKDGELIETVQNTANGNIPFSPLTFTQDDIGEHAYTIQEVDGGEAGMSYDPRTLAFTIQVKDIGGHQLEATVIKPDSVTFNNTFTPQTMDIVLEKQWTDNNNAFGLRPTSIQAQLLQNNIPLGQPVTISAANGWIISYPNLPIRDSGGNLYVYTLRETTVLANYLPTYQGLAAGRLIIINTLVEQQTPPVPPVLPPVPQPVILPDAPEIIPGAPGNITGNMGETFE